MTFAPLTILAVRHLFQSVTSLSSSSLGVVGSVGHAQTGTSYHLGKGDLKSSAYSIVESSRDRNGLSEAASAIDIGYFAIKTPKGTFRNRDMTKWIVAECKANAPDTRDIREIIYSPDGQVVKRYDDLGIRSTGDGSHLSHDHVSWYRDSEKRDKTSIFRRWLTFIGAIKGDDVTEDDFKRIAKMIADSEARVKADIAARVDDWLKLPSGSKGNPSRTFQMGLNDAFDLRGVLIGDKPDTAAAQLKPDSPLMLALADIKRTAQMVEALTDGQTVTQEQVTEALRVVLREGVGG